MKGPRCCLLLMLLAAGMAAGQGARYLVIVPDSLGAAIQPLVDWRLQTGMSVRVTRMSEIVPPTREGIRNCIVNAYNFLVPRPEYVLLVGDTTLIPVGTTWPCPSDDYYADVDGHFKAELAVGRFPCRNELECGTMVAKTLAYERAPARNDTAWYQRALVAVRFDDAGDTLGYYVRDLRFVREVMRDSAGFSVDSLFWRDKLGWHRQGPDDARAIASAVNAGRGFILFRGFGAWDSMWHNWNMPMNVRPDDADNGVRLPVVYGGCCQTVFAPNGAGIGEAWLRAGTPASPRGAVAYIGNSIHALASPWRSKVIQGFFKAAFVYDSLTLGKALLFGKDSLYRWLKANPAGDTAKDSVVRYIEQSTMGDPGLQLWTGYPRAILAGHAATVTLRPSVLRVRVTRGGQPCARALACAWKHGDFQVSALTDSNGCASLSLAPKSSGQFRVTVTGQNLRPYVGTCTVLPSDAGAPPSDDGTMESPTPTTTPAESPRWPVLITPNPVADGLATVRLSLPADGVVSVSVHDVSGRTVLHSTPKVRDSSFTLYLRDLAAGVYVVKVTSGGLSATRKLVLER